MPNDGVADTTYEKMLSKVQALLAKAESTKFPEEADALFAKAQELMTRYTIDEALARGHRPRAGDVPVLRSFSIDDPYRTAKRALLTAVASANDVRVIIGHESSITLAGYGTDIETTELLFASLLVQATREMNIAVTAEEPDRLRAFRHAFFTSYGARIGTRLREARWATAADVEATTGASLVPLFKARDDEVNAFLKTQFPRLRSARRTSVSDAGGYRAGRSAADRADLGQRGIKSSA